jgi:membrane protein
MRKATQAETHGHPRWPLVGLLREALALWSDRNAFQYAAALAFYTLVSLAPLLLVVVTMGGWVFGDEAIRGELAGRLEGVLGAPAAEAVQDAVRASRIEASGMVPTLLAGAALLFGATTVLAQMQVALNRIWGVVARPGRSGLVVFVMRRALALAVLVLIGLLLLASVIVTTVVSGVLGFAADRVPLPGIVASLADLGVSILLATLLFALLFKTLPDVHLEWRDTWRGTFVTSLLFVVGQFLIALYLTRAAPGSAYGAAGSLFLVLVWVYYSSLIVLFGAALTKVSMTRRGGVVVPRKGVVRVRVELLEEGGGRTHPPPAAPAGPRTRWP